VRREEYLGPPPVPRSELESVRRALRNLRKQGLVIDPVYYPRRIYYRRPRKQPNSG
jgi:hypothetical protein